MGFFEMEGKGRVKKKRVGDDEETGTEFSEIKLRR